MGTSRYTKRQQGRELFANIFIVFGITIIEYFEFDNIEM